MGHKKGHQEEESRGSSARNLEEEVKFLHLNSDNFKGGKRKDVLDQVDATIKEFF